MSNLKITQMLVPKTKYGTKCPYTMKPAGITVHNTANNASALAEVSYMLKNNNQVSYHYAVDDKQAVQAIPLNRNAWHAGDGSGFGNRQSIGIEICYSKSGGSRFAKAEKNAAKLIAQLMIKYGWKESDIGGKRINTHKYRSKKNCPHRTLPHMTKFWTMCKAEYRLLVRSKAKAKPKPKYPKYKITAPGLTVRKGAGIKYKKVTTYKRGTILNITQIKKNGKTPWGKLLNGKGWVSLVSKYSKKVN